MTYEQWHSDYFGTDVPPSNPPPPPPMPGVLPSPPAGELGAGGKFITSLGHYAKSFIPPDLSNIPWNEEVTLPPFNPNQYATDPASNATNLGLTPRPFPFDYNPMNAPPRLNEFLNAPFGSQEQWDKGASLVLDTAAAARGLYGPGVKRGTFVPKPAMRKIWEGIPEQMDEASHLVRMQALNERLEQLQARLRQMGYSEHDIQAQIGNIVKMNSAPPPPLLAYPPMSHQPFALGMGDIIYPDPDKFKNPPPKLGLGYPPGEIVEPDFRTYAETLARDPRGNVAMSDVEKNFWLTATEDQKQQWWKNKYAEAKNKPWDEHNPLAPPPYVGPGVPSKTFPSQSWQPTDQESLKYKLKGKQANKPQEKRVDDMYEDLGKLSSDDFWKKYFADLDPNKNPPKPPKGGGEGEGVL